MIVLPTAKLCLRLRGSSYLLGAQKAHIPEWCEDDADLMDYDLGLRLVRRVP